MSILSGLFGGEDMSKYYDKAGEQYQSWMEKALEQLKQSKGEAGGDIEKYYQQALGYGQPYREAGGKALDAYMGSLGLSGTQGRQAAIDAFKAGPGFQFALKQGMRSAQMGAAGAGLTGSGAEQRELQRTGQGLAEQEYGGFQNRLGALAGMGAQESNLAASLSAQEGGALSKLASGYGASAANIYGNIGTALSEQQLAEAAAKERENQNIWQSIGSIGGIAALRFIH